ncbi:hypothetical protein [Pseudobacteriovorax antillogorgiicola]|uniref:Uncharacterized protein n=1 Tax=Pseudobacteriovorax antillogorgiicola TaxID=1513793 RepID=A0A1Y6CT68_9BACT|nr:hypothetical protein [Pseudobacteriovorax antillogorgiicola]TCS45621.1 hypothetical protein EDD56_12713 [Pseudobacteriovorax antillogorgiicola]SMF72436.1 hypothetical protein SAMN06296036_12712 [Pseudobacteriovorax antillogorgiicola]
MKKSLLMAATAGLALGVQSLEPAEAAPPKKKKSVECFGVNSCKGSGSCSVNQEQIDAAQKTFKGKYKKSATYACKGNNACGAPHHLAWVSKPKKECLSEGGFYFMKTESGKLKVKGKKKS